MHPQHQSPLGQKVHYADQYDAGLLFPIPRAPQRQAPGFEMHEIRFTVERRWPAVLRSPPATRRASRFPGRWMTHQPPSGVVFCRAL